MRVPAARIAPALLLGVIVGFCAADAYAQSPSPGQPPKSSVPPVQTTKPADVAGAKIGLPDLAVIGAKADGAKLTVTVKNWCKTNAPQSRLSLTTYKGATKASGAVILLEYDVPPVKGGASAEVVFDVSTEPKVVTLAGKFYELRVDPLNKIKEAVETNNSADTSHFPFPNSATACDPK